MSESQKKILEMLANKKISVDEAYRLLNALKDQAGGPESAAEATTTGRPKAKYLRVCVAPAQGHEHDDEAEVVNVRVPLSLIRSGIKFSSLLPPEARDKVSDTLHEKGIDLDMRNLKPEELEEIVEALADLQIDVVSDKEVVKVFVE